MELSAIADLKPDQLHSLLEGIGNTPMVPIYLTIHDQPRKIYLKLEGTNPSGSIKVRTAYALVCDLEQRGVLQDDSIILESTSGNLGVALSMLARARGYHFLAIVDPKTTDENIAKMRSFGAEIEMVHQPDKTGGYLFARLERVRQLCEQSSLYVWTNQYSNMVNPAIHYKQTALEIDQQVNGLIDAIFIAVSTGGTLAGVARYFREANPQTRIIGVDAHGSVIFGAPPAPRKLTGIGASRPSDFITPDLYDDFLLVNDEEAFAFCRALFHITNIKVGGSSGAALAACARYLADHHAITEAVCICPDTGENYASSIYNDEWLTQQELHIDALVAQTQALFSHERVSTDVNLEEASK